MSLCDYIQPIRAHHFRASLCLWHWDPGSLLILFAKLFWHDDETTFFRMNFTLEKVFHWPKLFPPFHLAMNPWNVIWNFSEDEDATETEAHFPRFIFAIFLGKCLARYGRPTWANRNSSFPRASETVYQLASLDCYRVGWSIPYFHSSSICAVSSDVVSVLHYGLHELIWCMVNYIKWGYMW